MNTPQTDLRSVFLWNPISFIGIGYTVPQGKEICQVANCNSCNGGCQSGNRVGALNSVCRSGCRYPYYTGPCPSAPCNDGCGNSCSHSCSCSRCGRGTNAQIIDLNSGGGCNTCGTCEYCGNRPCGCSNCGNNSCGCNPCDNGCGNCSCGCGACDNCHACDNTGCSGHTPHGVFTAGGPLNLSAGGAVNFKPRVGESHCFGTSYGSILIRHPGLYYAAITVDIPKHSDVNTVMRLELDGRAITPPEIPVCADCDGCAASFCGHAIFHACAGSLLKLITLRELAIECSTAQPVFTITLFRIC